MKTLHIKLLLLACLISTNPILSFWEKSDTSKQKEANQKFITLLPHALPYMDDQFTPTYSQSKKGKINTLEKIQDTMEEFMKRCGTAGKCKTVAFDNCILLLVQLEGHPIPTPALVGEKPNASEMKNIQAYIKQFSEDEKKGKSKLENEKLRKEIVWLGAIAEIVWFGYKLKTNKN